MCSLCTKWEIYLFYTKGKAAAGRGVGGCGCGQPRRQLMYQDASLGRHPPARQASSLRVLVGTGPYDTPRLVRIRHWPREADRRPDLPRVGRSVRQRSAAHAVLGRAPHPLGGGERAVARHELDRACRRVTERGACGDGVQGSAGPRGACGWHQRQARRRQRARGRSVRRRASRSACRGSAAGRRGEGL